MPREDEYEEWLEKSSKRKVLYYSINFVVLGVLIFGVVYVLTRPTVTPTSYTSKYGFETDTQGWDYQTWEDSMAITAVSQHTENAKYGSGSLQCTVNLIGDHDNNSKGEVWVDMHNTPPEGVTAPVDLSNAIVSVWLYMPAEAAGDPSKPNGIQLFFKDDSWNNRYSSWKNIGTEIRTDQWRQIRVNMVTESWAYPLPGDNENIPCDLTRVRALGVKIGIGGGSTENFSGTFLIDDVDW